MRPRAFCPTSTIPRRRNTRKRGRALQVLAIARIKCLAAIVAAESIVDVNIIPGKWRSFEGKIECLERVRARKVERFLFSMLDKRGEFVSKSFPFR